MIVPAITVIAGVGRFQPIEVVEFFSHVIVIGQNRRNLSPAHAICIGQNRRNLSPLVAVDRS